MEKYLILNFIDSSYYSKILDTVKKVNLKKENFENKTKEEFYQMFKEEYIKLFGDNFLLDYNMNTTDYLFNNPKNKLKSITIVEDIDIYMKNTYRRMQNIKDIRKGWKYYTLNNETIVCKINKDNLVIEK